MEKIKEILSSAKKQKDLVVSLTVVDPIGLRLFGVDDEPANAWRVKMLWDKFGGNPSKPNKNFSAIVLNDEKK